MFRQSLLQFVHSFLNLFDILLSIVTEVTHNILLNF